MREYSNISKPIDVICETADTLRLSDMTELQGELKTRTESDFDVIFASIQRRGIAFPFFVWNDNGVNYVLDGHGRYGALVRASQVGYVIPPLPVVYIKADDINQAKHLLLRLNSRYGTMTLDGLLSFADGHEIDFSEINIPELPELSCEIDSLLSNMEADNEEALANIDTPTFHLYCPECGERHYVTDEELREHVDED